jgi:hypothetical protein
VGTVFHASQDCSRKFVMTVSPRSHIYQFWIEGQLVTEERLLPKILDRVSAELTTYVAEHAPHHVFVHAGVVSWKGSALLLPGPSFAGKTTLVAELLHLGATYYSDEYAVLDAQGRVHPYARDLRLRRPGKSMQESVSVHQLNSIAGIEAVPASMVVFTTFQEDGKWSPRPLTPGKTVLEMLRHTISVQRSPARALSTLTETMKTARALHSVRGEASRTASLLLSEMSRSRGNSITSEAQARRACNPEQCQK